MIVCCGAAGTGKTSVASYISARYGIKYFPSVVREFHLKNNLQDETVRQAMPVKKRLEFQIALLDFYLGKLSDMISSGKPVIMDRSPFCHLAYIIYDAPELIDDKMLDRVLNKVFCCLPPSSSIFYFPFPVPWRSTDKSIIDGFRSAPSGKNAIINAVIWRYSSQMCNHYTVFPASIVERSDYIMRMHQR